VETREDAQLLPLKESGELYYQGIRRNQLSVLLWVRTADARQKRATIISYSCAGWNNFRVAQQGNDIAFQLRTPLLAALESGQELEAPAALESGRDTLVAVVYDGRRASIYMDGRLAGEDDFGATRIPFSVPALGLGYGAGAALYLAWMLYRSPRFGRLALFTGAVLMGALLIPRLSQTIYRGLSPSLMAALALGIYASHRGLYTRRGPIGSRTSLRN